MCVCEKTQKNKFFCHDIEIMIIFVCLLFRIMEGNMDVHSIITRQWFAWNPHEKDL